MSYLIILGVIFAIIYSMSANQKVSPPKSAFGAANFFETYDALSQSEHTTAELWEELGENIYDHILTESKPTETENLLLIANRSYQNSLALDPSNALTVELWTERIVRLLIAHPTLSASNQLALFDQIFTTYFPKIAAEPEDLIDWASSYADSLGDLRDDLSAIVFKKILLLLSVAQKKHDNSYSIADDLFDVIENVMAQIPEHLTPQYGKLLFAVLTPELLKDLSSSQMDTVKTWEKFSVPSQETSTITQEEIFSSPSSSTPQSHNSTEQNQKRWTILQDKPKEKTVPPKSSENAWDALRSTPSAQKQQTKQTPKQTSATAQAKDQWAKLGTTKVSQSETQQTNKLESKQANQHAQQVLTSSNPLNAPYTPGAAKPVTSPDAIPSTKTTPKTDAQKHSDQNANMRQDQANTRSATNDAERMNKLQASASASHAPYSANSPQNQASIGEKNALYTPAPMPEYTQKKPTAQQFAAQSYDTIHPAPATTPQQITVNVPQASSTNADTSIHPTAQVSPVPSITPPTAPSTPRAPAGLSQPSYLSRELPDYAKPIKK